MRYLSLARLLLAAMLAINGAAMLATPEFWYAMTPGVMEIGPHNLHFVRDIGCAYLVSGAGLFWLWRNPHAWPAAIAGGAFLALHALVHVGEMLAGGFDPHHAWRDLPGVFPVPVLAFLLAWPCQRTLHTLPKEDAHAEMDRTAPARRL